MFGLPDIDMLSVQAAPAPLAAALPPVQTPAAPTSANKRKFNTVIDQSDEAEIRTLPASESTPSSDQVSALHTKVIERDEETYGDFSVLIPFGRNV